jgi:hypothetical protein
LRSTTARVSLARLGADGLLASNPLDTFRVLNNFTMCHGAILEGTTGPNGAFFSRGTGTVHALAEAVHAIESGDCERALAGGSDTALHPATWAELARDGFTDLVPSAGAATWPSRAPTRRSRSSSTPASATRRQRAIRLDRSRRGRAARAAPRDRPDAGDAIDVTAGAASHSRYRRRSRLAAPRSDRERSRAGRRVVAGPDNQSASSSGAAPR